MSVTTFPDVSGVPDTSLQGIYNASGDVAIVTDATRGALKIRRGSAADTDNIIEGRDGAGTVTFAVTGNGKISSATRITAGGNVETLSAGKSIVATDKQSQLLNPNGANRDVTLYASPTAGDYFLFRNSGTGGFNLVLKNNAGTTLVTIGNGVSVAVLYDGTNWILV